MSSGYLSIGNNNQGVGTMGAEEVVLRRDAECAFGDSSAISDFGCNLNGSGTILIYAVNETIFCEDDPANCVFEVIAGVVKIYKQLLNGRQQIINFSSRGDFLGIGPTESYVISADAVTQVELAAYPRAHFEGLLDKYPAFGRLLLAMTAHQLAVTQEHLVLIAQKTAQEKVASFLLMMLDQSTDCGKPSGQMDLGLSRGDIANFLGLTVETVCRALSDLKRRRVISMPETRRVIILDNEVLLKSANSGRKSRNQIQTPLHRLSRVNRHFEERKITSSAMTASISNRKSQPNGMGINGK
jgi:CRP-like cAMP-binding protein